MDRVDKVISNNTNYTRKDIGKLISSKRVRVNSDIINSKDYKIDTNKDLIYIDDILLDVNKFIYLILNKPKGYVSATRDNRDKTVLDLVPDVYKKRNLFPVGRLDKDTTGLMIITDDGDFSHNLLSPRKHVCKKYYVGVDNKIDRNLIDRFRDGIDIGGYVTKSSVLDIIDDYHAYVTIDEGKYHQIKRMFSVNGLNVVELMRVKMGGLELPNDLEIGFIRRMSEEEMRSLYE